MNCDKFKAIDQRIKGKSSFVILYFRCLYEFAMITYAGYFFIVKHLQKMAACSLVLFFSDHFLNTHFNFDIRGG